MGLGVATSDGSTRHLAPTVLRNQHVLQTRRVRYLSFQYHNFFAVNLTKIFIIKILYIFLGIYNLLLSSRTKTFHGIYVKGYRSRYILFTIGWQ